MKLTKSESGKLGGLARVNKAGNPGTVEGRRLGGINSQVTHKKNHTNFVQRKEIFLPKESDSLAEFVGIMLGDGHIGKYQAAVTTNGETDIEHALYISKLATSLFLIKAPIRKKKNTKAIEVVFSSYNLCRFLELKCFKSGNKIINNVSVPDWIIKHDSYIKFCLRGLFDTDGCVFMDKHIIKGVKYQHLGLAFTNYNENILSFFKNSLIDLGFHPTQRTKHYVFLRRKKEIDSYFKLIGTSNSKHLNKYDIFVKQTGRVA